MCHASALDSTLWNGLYDLDQRIAEAVQAQGCPRCGSVLHYAMYPRKPRGACRELIGETYCSRFSFCCKSCRRRCTPPSVRFLGRKVYLGLIVVLAGAVAQGLNERRYQKLIEHLPLSRYTLKRWLQWWQEQLPDTPFWRELQGRVPSLSQTPLPIALFDLLTGNLPTVCQHIMVTFLPLTTGSCSRYSRVSIGTQKMSI